MNPITESAFRKAMEPQVAAKILSTKEIDDLVTLKKGNGEVCDDKDDDEDEMDAKDAEEAGEAMAKALADLEADIAKAEQASMSLKMPTDTEVGDEPDPDQRLPRSRTPVDLTDTDKLIASKVVQDIVKGISPLFAEVNAKLAKATAEIGVLKAQVKGLHTKHDLVTKAQEDRVTKGNARILKRLDKFEKAQERTPAGESGRSADGYVPAGHKTPQQALPNANGAASHVSLFAKGLKEHIAKAQDAIVAKPVKSTNDNIELRRLADQMALVHGTGQFAPTIEVLNTIAKGVGYAGAN